MGLLTAWWGEERWPHLCRTCQETFPPASHCLGADQSTCSAPDTWYPHPKELGKAGCGLLPCCLCLEMGCPHHSPEQNSCCGTWGTGSLTIPSKLQCLGPSHAWCNGGAHAKVCTTHRGKRQEPSLWPCSQGGLTCYTWPLVWGASTGRLPSACSLWPAVGGGWPPTSWRWGELGSALQGGNLNFLVPLRVILALN